MAEQALVSFLSQFIFSFDGAVIGVALACGAVRTAFKYNASSAALCKIKEAPEVHVSDLRTLLLESDYQSMPHVYNRRIVMVHGTVKPSCKNNVLVCEETGDKAVIIERAQTYVYSGWRSFFRSSYDLWTIFGRSLRKKDSTSLRMVPFVITENDQQPRSNYVVVNMDGSMQRLPLTTVYNRLQPINASPYTFIQAVFLPEYPVGLLDEEKILPPGKDITAVGVCSFNKGVPEIKSCKDLPYFLSEMTKDRMLVDLTIRTKVLFWCSIVMGCLSIGVLGYAALRGWNRWKVWKQAREIRRRSQLSDSGGGDDADVEDTEGIPDGQLCVVCLVRRRMPAFIPCGHVVCCRRCALAIERDRYPKCPVCCQSIGGSMRVYYA